MHLSVFNEYLRLFDRCNVVYKRRCIYYNISLSHAR